MKSLTISHADKDLEQMEHSYTSRMIGMNACIIILENSSARSAKADHAYCLELSNSIPRCILSQNVYNMFIKKQVQKCS